MRIAEAGEGHHTKLRARCGAARSSTCPSGPGSWDARSLISPGLIRWASTSSTALVTSAASSWSLYSPRSRTRARNPSYFVADFLLPCSPLVMGIARGAAVGPTGSVRRRVAAVRKALGPRLPHGLTQGTSEAPGAERVGCLLISSSRRCPAVADVRLAVPRCRPSSASTGCCPLRCPAVTAGSYSRRRAARSAILRTSLTVRPAEFAPAYASNKVSETSRKNHQR